MSFVIEHAKNPEGWEDYVVKKTGLKPEVIKDIFRHNVLTKNQVALITGKSIVGIEQLIRPRWKKNNAYTVLNPVYPFPEGEIEEKFKPKKGRAFIAKDQKLYDFIKKCLK